MTDIVASARVRAESRYFYFYMALSCVAVAFLGFMPTYWLPMAAGTFKSHPVVHIHGMICFAWVSYFAFQTWLAASGRVARHRAIGLIGVSLATAMTIFGVQVAIQAVKDATPAGFAEQAKAFMIVGISGIAFFAGCIAMALANIRRPEWHKRFMLLATVSILPAAIVRWFFTFQPPAGVPPPSYDLRATAVASLLLVIAILHDWRTRGRPHAAYITGGGVFAIIHLLQQPVSETQFWHRTADWIVGLTG